VGRCVLISLSVSSQRTDDPHYGDVPCFGVLHIQLILSFSLLFQIRPRSRAVSVSVRLLDVGFSNAKFDRRVFSGFHQEFKSG